MLSGGNFTGEKRDSAFLAILGALVDCHGRVGAAKALGVNYRTLRKTLDSRQLTRHMRQALQKFGGSSPPSGSPQTVADGAEVDQVQDASLLQRVIELEVENHDLKMVVEAQTAHLQELWRRVASLEERQGSGVFRRWGQKNRRRGEAGGVASAVTHPVQGGVVTLVPRLKEASLLGDAAPVVARWREARNKATVSNDPVERAQAKVQMLLLELDLLQRFFLTLPPHLEPWDPVTFSQETYRRQSADLPKARQELERARKRQGMAT